DLPARADRPRTPVVTILAVQDLAKHFGTRRVLQGASFAVAERDRIGMIGANGAGKSTLLKMLVGDETPDEGTITWKRGITIEYVAQEPRIDPDSTVAQALARDGVPEHEVANVAGALELPAMDARVGNLSNGERRRVALGHALLGRPDVLALDEPTNHLDAR